MHRLCSFYCSAQLAGCSLRGRKPAAASTDSSDHRFSGNPGLCDVRPATASLSRLWQGSRVLFWKVCPGQVAVGLGGTWLGPLPRCRAPSASASARIPNAPLLPFFGPQKKVFKWQKLAEALKIIIWVVLTKFLLSPNRTPSLPPSVEPQSCLRGVQGTVVLEDGFVAVPTHHCPPPPPRILVRGRNGAGNVTLQNWRGHLLMGRIHRGLWHMCS